MASGPELYTYIPPRRIARGATSVVRDEPMSPASKRGPIIGCCWSGVYGYGTKGKEYVMVSRYITHEVRFTDIALESTVKCSSRS